MIFPPKQAGVDIGTGWAVDSFLSPPKSGYYDPWGERLTANFIDVVINHEITFFPSPSSSVINLITLRNSDNYLPQIFSKKFEVVKPYFNQTAEEIPLSDNKIDEEFSAFKDWVYDGENYENLKIWLNYHMRDEKLNAQINVRMPTFYVNDFLKKKERLKFAKDIGIEDMHIVYAFDTWIRTLQYYQLFGDSTSYFPHEYRSAAILHTMNPQMKLYRKQISPDKFEWSWGQYFLYIMKENKKFKSMDWLADNISIVQKETLKRKATCYDLAGMHEEKKIDTITEIASDLELPAKINDKMLDSIKNTYLVIQGASDVSVIAWPNNLPVAVMNFLITCGGIPIAWWKGKLPKKFEKLSFTKGYIEWPNLFKKSRR